MWYYVGVKNRFKHARVLVVWYLFCQDRVSCYLCFVLCVACLTVFVNCLVKQFEICLGVVVILLFSVVGVDLLDRPCLVFQRVCVLCL